MLIGYARVSTADQKLDLQRDELKCTGCRKLFTDVAGGANTDRPGRAAALAFARKGDTIVAGDQDHGELAIAEFAHQVTGERAAELAHQVAGERAGQRAIGELAIATAAMVAQVIAAAGAEATYPTGRQRREKLR